MNSNNQYDWIPFYKEVASKLLDYKENRPELIEKVKQIYNVTGIPMPTLEKGEIIDMDPFTFFGLFNKSSMKEENRNKIVKAVADIFDIKCNPPTSFISLPVLNNQNATFYTFKDTREDGDIDGLWELFEAALKYAQDGNDEDQACLINAFDAAIGKKGNGNSKITMGLFWIAPDTFLNLDSRNTWYIYYSEQMPKSLTDTLPEFGAKIPAILYFEITEKLKEYLESSESKFRSFNELSFEAWRYSEEHNEKEKQAKKGADSSLGDPTDYSVHYWLYAPGEKAYMWEKFYQDGIMAIGWSDTGDLSAYDSKEEIKDALREIRGTNYPYMHPGVMLWQFANEMVPGDIVFVKRGRHEIVGRGEVISDYEYDENAEGDFAHVRKVRWTDKGEWSCEENLQVKTLTDITNWPSLVKRIGEAFSDEDGEIEGSRTVYPEYTEMDFLDAVYISDREYDELVSALDYKRNIILEGAPGVGKTFIAKRLAYAMMGEMNVERVMMVQFHQSYSYEDFIMGFRPTSSGFELRNGAFYNFCKKAELDSENDYFFIIDEINRGNLSKIFGELFMLLESDKRGPGNKIQLLYSDELFYVPENVYIIGMMNTADRSLAMLDYALRRRFAFFKLKPGFDSKGFQKYQESLNNPKFNSLINCVKSINEAIKDDESLGEGFCIGHSYFCKLESEDNLDYRLYEIVEREIIPIIEEYWFDEISKVRDWSKKLRDAVK